MARRTMQWRGRPQRGRDVPSRVPVFELPDDELTTEVSRKKLADIVAIGTALGWEPPVRRTKNKKAVVGKSVEKVVGARMKRLKMKPVVKLKAGARRIKVKRST